jgi:hypothetical protein
MTHDTTRSSAPFHDCSVGEYQATYRVDCS